MSLTTENIVLLGSILLFLGILASRTMRYGIPALALFMVVGMLAGSDGPGGIQFSDPGIARFIGTIALSFILFSGGLETRLEDIRPVLWKGISLSSVGVILTALTMGVAVMLLTEFTLLEGFLLGAIVSSTDAAAVFSILRSRSVGLKGNLRPLLELESGSNDPMAYVLTILFTFLLTSGDVTYAELGVIFVRQMILGAIAGYLMGVIMHRILNWINLEYPGLYSVLLITMMLFTFSFTDYTGGNGFLAVYIAGCILGNRTFIHKKSLVKHFDGQAWLMQAVMFITLGLLVNPFDIIPYIIPGLLISFTLILIARPLSVFLSLAFFRISTRKKLMISWVGLRGAVPIVLATYPLTAGVDKAGIIFNIVFFISLTSILLQGTTLPLMAGWLGLTIPAEIRKQTVLDCEMTGRDGSMMIRTTLTETSACLGKALVELDFGGRISISSIERKGKFITPDGATRLEKGDLLSVTASSPEDLERFYRIIGANA